MVLKYMKFFNQQKGQFISQVTILSMVFGFAAGVVGQIFADVYLDPWNQDYSINGSISNEDVSPIIPELKRVKKFLGIEQDFKVNESMTKLSSSIIGIYSKKSATNDILNQVYLGEELIATSTGSSKQEAQVKAADRGLKKKEWE